MEPFSSIKHRGGRSVFFPSLNSPLPKELSSWVKFDGFFIKFIKNQTYFGVYLLVHLVFCLYFCYNFVKFWSMKYLYYYITYTY